MIRAKSKSIPASGKKIVKQRRERTDDLGIFRLAFDYASDLIIIANPAGVILYVNKAVEKETGYRQEELVGRKAGKKNEVFGGQMSRNFRRTLWKTIREDKKIFVGEVTNRKKNGEEYAAEVHISPILNKKGEVIYFVGIERNINRGKEVDRAKTEFVSLASHQLRTPLTSISLSVEMLCRGAFGPLSDEQKSAALDIYSDVVVMAELIETFLNVSKIDMGTFSPEYREVDIAEIADEVLATFRPQLESKKQILKTKYMDNLPRLMTDSKIVKNVLQNLLSNAIKYTPEGGRIRLEIKKNGSSCVIMVKDTGYGIPAGECSMLFTKFFRAKNVTKKETAGTGLGLYLARAMLSVIGGSIVFESAENRGSIFYVSLPLDRVCTGKKMNISK